MNKQITRNNYEVYFLDYMEGKLDVALQFQFQQFLRKNPDLSIELDEMMEADISLPVDNLEFKHKDNLKKPVEVFGDLSFEDTAIARLEGDLSLTQTKNFDNYIETHKKEKKEYLLFLKTKLIPDLSVQFTEKSSLKRFTLLGLTHRNFSVISAAASIILIFSVYMFASKYFIDETRYYSARTIESNMPVNDYIAKADKQFIETIIESQPKEYLAKTKNIKSINNTIAKYNADIERISQFASLEKMVIKNAAIPVSNPAKSIINFRNNNSEQLQIATLTSDSRDDFLSPKQFFNILFKKKVLQQNPEKINDDKVNFWDIADASVNGLNKVTGSKMKLKTQYDDSGDLIAYAFSSNLISFEKTKNRRH